MMFRHCGTALVQQKLEAVVVSFDDEGAPPEVRLPVAHSLNQTNDLFARKRLARHVEELWFC